MQGIDLRSNKPPDAETSEATGKNQVACSSGGNVSAGRLAALGGEIAIVMALCVLVGYRADAMRGGGMFWTLAGAAIGTAFWIYELWNMARVLNRNGKREKGTCEKKDKGDA